MEPKSTIGKIDSMYDIDWATTKSRIRCCRDVANANGVVHVVEDLERGDVVSIILRPNHRLQNVVIQKQDRLQVYATKSSFHYWITVGSSGAWELTGRIVKDTDGMFAKFKANLHDVPFRSYLVSMALVGHANTGDPQVPNVMTTKEAARYLCVSTSKVYKLAASGELKRTRQKRFRRTDLDTYLARPAKRSP
ncbi:MAG: helix-turn-helix domain-containing protein [Calditrichaeota bacterium]|nr:helix-turn-helix domain-containing protein [Calditrichota bacterium]